MKYQSNNYQFTINSDRLKQYRDV